jgi:hypothetical protein
LELRACLTNKDGSIHWVFISVDDNDLYPPATGFVRGTIFPSGYHIIPKGENLFEVHMITHLDLGGSLPGWIVRKGITQETMNNASRIQKVLDSRAKSSKK